MVEHSDLPLIEVPIGEVDEPQCSPPSERIQPGGAGAADNRKSTNVQRSKSDRYSYKAAIFQQTNAEAAVASALANV